VNRAHPGPEKGPNLSERGAHTDQEQIGETLWLGAGEIDVTPTRPGPLAGYEARGDTESTGTADGLRAALVILAVGDDAVAWLAVDSLAVPAALADRLRAAVREGLGDDGVQIVVAASHTHSAPRGWVGSIHPGHSGVDNPIAIAELEDRIRTLAESIAARPREQVVLSWAARQVGGLAANRLERTGPHDSDLGVLLVRSAEHGAIRAAVFDAANHPTVLGPHNLDYSADWPGAARRILQAALQASNEASGHRASPPVVLFLQGAAGDISSRYTRRAANIGEVGRLGTIAAAAAMEAIAHDGSEVRGRPRHASRVLELERRPLPDIDAAQHDLDDAIRDRESLTGVSVLDPRVRIAQSRIDGARVQRALALAEIAPVVPLVLSVIAIGDVAWVHVPVELFTDVGRRIRARSPFPVTRVVGYADDYRGYLVDEAAYEASSYEALSTFFRPEAADLLAKAAQQILEEIR
jgi:neutral ceramidase